MVQLHAGHSGLEVTPTEDVDVVLHIETGTAPTTGVSTALNKPGHKLEEPTGRKTPPTDSRAAPTKSTS